MSLPLARRDLTPATRGRACVWVSGVAIREFLTEEMDEVSMGLADAVAALWEATELGS